MMLTVTLPVYNAMPYLPAAVESILSQSYADFDFLIIDDGSTDGSADYLRSSCDPRIKLKVRENRGLGATLNELFRDSRTEYVARMDADDISPSDRLSKQMAYLREHGHVVALGTGLAFIVGDRLVGAPRPAADHSAIRHRLLQKRPGLNHPTMVVKRAAWQGIGGYRFSGAGEDLDFCLRLCDVGRVANIPQPSYHYRLREESLSFTTRGETQVGYAFAVACARARERGLAEPEFLNFHSAWERRSSWARFGQFFSDAGQGLYRRSIIRRGEGHAVASYVYLAGAAICRPRIALSRLATRQA